MIYRFYHRLCNFSCFEGIYFGLFDMVLCRSIFINMTDTFKSFEQSDSVDQQNALQFIVLPGDPLPPTNATRKQVLGMIDAAERGETV